MLQFVFIALKLDHHLNWTWAVMSSCVLYAFHSPYAGHIHSHVDSRLSFTHRRAVRCYSGSLAHTLSRAALAHASTAHVECRGIHYARRAVADIPGRGKPLERLQMFES